MNGLAPRDLQRAVARHRALLAAGLAAAAVAAGLTAVAPTSEPGVPVLTAARDLAAGVVLTPEDLGTTPLPGALVPTGSLTEMGDAVGQHLAGPVRRGEPLTDVRLLGSSLLDAGGGEVGNAGNAGNAGEVAVPVRVAEPAIATLVQAGDSVDILAASPEGGPAAAVVAAGVRVLSVPVVGDDPGEGALLIVAASRSAAARLAASAVTDRLSVVLLPR